MTFLYGIKYTSTSFLVRAPDLGVNAVKLFTFVINKKLQGSSIL
jgi:hypothetical protein